MVCKKRGQLGFKIRIVLHYLKSYTVYDHFTVPGLCYNTLVRYFPASYGVYKETFLETVKTDDHFLRY